MPRPRTKEDKEPVKAVPSLKEEVKKEKTPVKVKTVAEEEPTTLEAKGQASVYFEKSITKNLGNYESSKVTVGVTLGIEPTSKEIEEIKKTIEICDSIVTEELETQIASLEK